LDRLEQDPLDCDTADKGQRHSADERAPVRPTPLQHLPGKKRPEHRHLALRKIEMIDRLVDHHHSERHRGIHRARRKPGHHLLQQ